MEPENDKIDIAEELKARFLQLPKVLQEAITSTHVETRLRGLSESHRLHLDQWQKLENEVRLTLFGFQQVDKLEENIKNEVGVSAEIASELAGDIAESIFQPIREELERELEHPDAKDKKVGELDQVRSEVLGGKSVTNAVSSIRDTPYAIPDTISVLPSTPPPPTNTEKSIRAPMSAAYTSQAPSHERKDIEGDPYREPTA